MCDAIRPASMGSGRGDRNQRMPRIALLVSPARLQWGPVVVTGIRSEGFKRIRDLVICFNGVRSW